MGYTEKQRAAFRKQFIQTRRYQIALIVPLGGAGVLLAKSEPYVADVGFEPIALGVAFLVLVAVGFTWLNWRCPACRKHLGRNLSPKSCPHCGVTLMSG